MQGERERNRQPVYTCMIIYTLHFRALDSQNSSLFYQGNGINVYIGKILFIYIICQVMVYTCILTYTHLCNWC